MLTSSVSQYGSEDWDWGESAPAEGFIEG